MRELPSVPLASEGQGMGQRTSKSLPWLHRAGAVPVQGAGAEACDATAGG